MQNTLRRPENNDWDYFWDNRAVETKLGSLGEVMGIVVGAFTKGSEVLHSLIHHLAISRVGVAGPQKGKRGQMRTLEAEIAM